jgi:hypothetical protein
LIGHQPRPDPELGNKLTLRLVLAGHPDPENEIVVTNA